jgi:hypothetical protein
MHQIAFHQIYTDRYIAMPAKNVFKISEGMLAAGLPATSNHGLLR